MKKFFEEFKKFALRGNMFDMAIGIIIGTAFSNVVNSLVNDIFMPIIGRITGNINFDDLFISLNGQHYNTLSEAVNADAPVIKYGAFIGIVLNFIIITFCIFVMIKAINEFHNKNNNSDLKICPYCSKEIDKGATRCPYCTSILAKNNSEVVPEKL